MAETHIVPTKTQTDFYKHPSLAVSNFNLNMFNFGLALPDKHRYQRI